MVVTLEVWWTSLVAADRDLLDMLDAGERARVESLERPADRGRSLVSAAMLRVAVANHLRIAPADVVVDRTCSDCGERHGAPRVVSESTPVPWVSVSHSGLLAVVALGTRGPVGVDVQRLEDLADPADGRGWVTREALFKAGTDAGLTVVHELSTPAPGYLAALAAPAGTPAAPRVRRWGLAV